MPLIELVMQELQVSRIRAMIYMDELVQIGLLSKHKKWIENHRGQACKSASWILANLRRGSVPHVFANSTRSETAS